VAQKAVDDGILLLTLDSDVSGGVARCFIGTDNYAAGRQMGEELLKRIPGGGKVGIIGHVAEANTAIERIRGATEVLEAAGCEVLPPVYCNNLSSEAQAAVNRMLVENLDMVGFVATNELAANGVAAALAAAGLQASVAAVTCDHSTGQIAYLEQGVIDATVVQKPFNMGYFSVQVATVLLNNPKDGSIPAVFDTGIEVITLENYFTPENQKLLFPLWE
jgi:ribose transport system substrate-binding protein